MFEITLFEARRRVRGTLYLSAALLAYVGLVVGLFPSIKEAGADIESFIESLPPEVRRSFVGEASTYTTIEGFLSAEMYQFVLLLVLGMFFAYAAASLIAGEVEGGEIDVLLVNPVSRTRLVVGKYLALVPGMVGVNAVMFAGTYYAVQFIDEEISFADLLALHTVSVPYLLACAGLGLLASVALDSQRRAQGIAAGGVFGMFLVHTVTLETDYEWVGNVTFARYFDPTDVLVDAEIDWTGVALLLVVALALVVASAELFERRDVS